MKAVKIIALTDKGKEGLDIMKQECGKVMVRWSLKKLKTKISFTDMEVTIENPAMAYCTNLNHEKSKLGIKQIISSYEDIGAKEGVDFKIEEIA